MGKIAYLPLSEGYYEIFKRYPFFVKSVVRHFDEGFVRIFLSKPKIKAKQERSGKKLTEIFKDGKTGKIVKHGIAARVTNYSVIVYETAKNGKVLCTKDFTDDNTRIKALSEAESFYEQYAM